MIERYLVVAERIRQELTDLERVVTRAERAISAAQQRLEDQDLSLDSAALNMHDFSAGLERVFHHIAATIDTALWWDCSTPIARTSRFFVRPCYNSPHVTQRP